MNIKISLITVYLLIWVPLIGQMPGVLGINKNLPQGTTLGANNTTGASGIALGNRVIMRGYVDFVLSYADLDLDDLSGHDSRFQTSSDIDFLFDFSPITAETHVQLNKDAVKLEQVFGRYAINKDFNISFGRQITTLGYEADEPTDLYSSSYAYVTDVAMIHPGLSDLRDDIVKEINRRDHIDADNTRLRRNYVDGIRANFNNGMFGFTIGLHDGYWGNADDFNGDNIAIDIAASMMIVPGLEARIGYAHQNVEISEDDKSNNLLDDEISQFNTWIEYRPGNLTLALEYDKFDLLGYDLWDVMVMGNYQFSNWFGLTLRYAHEDLEIQNNEFNSDRITLAFLFSLTENFDLNLEYSYTDADYDNDGGNADEVYVEGLLSF
jgi:hypothetical protein